MFLSEIFEQLTYGELSSLFMSGSNDVGITTKDYPKILSYVNTALTALHTRFPLKQEEVIIKLQDNIQIYYLDSRYAMTTPHEDPANPDPYFPRYIDDSKFAPFVDNVLKIERVFNEDGQELFLNDSTEYWSVHTPAHNAIQIPYPEKENSLVVEYRADHLRITPKKMVADPVPGPYTSMVEVDMDPATEVVSIPPEFLVPLLYFVGSRAFASLNSDQNAEGNNYFQKYDAACRQLEKFGVSNEVNDTNLKLDKKGWV